MASKIKNRRNDDKRAKHGSKQGIILKSPTQEIILSLNVESIAVFVLFCFIYLFWIQNRVAYRASSGVFLDQSATLRPN